MFLFFMENSIIAIIVWAAIFLIAIGIELTVSELVSIWFSGGSLIAFILACFNVHWTIQLAVFLVISLVLLIFTRPFVKKKLDLKNQEEKTNIDSLIGQEIIITKDVSKRQKGEGKIRDVIWTCTTEDDEVLTQNTFAIIKKIEGNHLVVTKKG